MSAAEQLHRPDTMLNDEIQEQFAEAHRAEAVQQQELTMQSQDALDDIVLQNMDQAIEDQRQALLPMLYEQPELAVATNEDEVVEGILVEETEQRALEPVKSAEQLALSGGDVATVDTPMVISNAFGYNPNTIDPAIQFVSPLKTEINVTTGPKVESASSDPLELEALRQLPSAEREVDHGLAAQNAAQEKKRQAEQLKAAIDKFGFRDGGEIPYVTNNYGKETLSRKLVGARTENGKDVLMIQINQFDKDGKVIHTEQVETDTKQLLDHLKNSDARMLSNKRQRQAAKNRKGLKDGPMDLLIHEETLDQYNAEKRNQLRSALKLEQRIEKGKLTWLDRTKIATANFMTGNTANSDPGDMRKRRLGKVIGGVGALVLLAAVGKGIVSHDHVNALNLQTSGIGEHTSSALDAVNLAPPNPSGAASSASETVRAFHDTVNQGDGITRTIMDYAQQNGHKLTPQQAFDIFEKTPRGMLDSISNTSPQDVTGGIGFNGPGNTTVPKEVIEFWNSQI